MLYNGNCTPSSSRFQGVRTYSGLLPHVERQSCHIPLHQSADSRTVSAAEYSMNIVPIVADFGARLLNRRST